MEKANQGPEFKDRMSIATETPVCELMFDMKKVESVWPEESENLNFIEQIESRKEQYNSIADVFDKLPSPATSTREALDVGLVSSEQLRSFYNSLSEILDDEDYQRLALYLPFEAIPDVSWRAGDDELDASVERFRQVYLDAWHGLLYVEDMRANFVDGDVLEVEARPSDPPRVVKAAHMIPWLAARGMINVDYVKSLLNVDSPILKRSVADTIDVLDDMGLLMPEDKKELLQIKESIPQEEYDAPLFISEKRKEWLARIRPDQDQLSRDEVGPELKRSSLSGPLSENLNSLGDIVTDISRKIMSCRDIKNVYPVVLLGGSRLKGYGDEYSDIDIDLLVNSGISEYEENRISETFRGYNLTRISLGNDLKLIGSKERWVHFLFNSAWVGSEESIKLFQNKLISEYFSEKNPTTRKRCLEKLEQDLLQYRLMHKGYAKYHSVSNPGLASKEEIDGRSAYYDSGYRQLATKLFIGKVFIPKIT